MKWEIIIGLELHAQITSKSKLFSSSPTKFTSIPNIHVSLFDAAMPGILPILNKYCVYQAVKTGIGLNGKINLKSYFDRKNYFYPDLPQGYQITQFYKPIVQNGYINITNQNNQIQKIRINRLHLEQDAGKSIHDQSEYYTYIDLNRAGIGLMEIVTEPDLRSPEDAIQFIKQFRTLVRYIGSCDGDMEKGSLRCDINISVKTPKQPLGIKCEIKNLNSTRNIMKAIQFEANRQIELIQNGKNVVSETRLFNPTINQTQTMRLKDKTQDYRYFPDPDLPPIILTQKLIQQLTTELPELPNQKKHKYIIEYGLNNNEAEILIEDKNIAEYYELAVTSCNPKQLANWIITDLFGKLNKHYIKISNCKITPKMLSKLINLISQKIISGKIAKIIFNDMFESGEDPETIIKKKSLIQISDKNILSDIINKLLLENQQFIKKYKNNKKQLLGYFIGKVMQKTQGKGNPNIINTLLKKKLDI